LFKHGDNFDIYTTVYAKDAGP